MLFDSISDACETDGVKGMILDFMMRQVLCNCCVAICMGMWSRSQLGQEFCILWAGSWNYVAAHAELSSCSARPWPGITPILSQPFTKHVILGTNHTGSKDTSYFFKSYPPISANIYIITLLQFVRVLQNMAKDLGFFGFVWAVLVLAFSVFMLGATGGSQGASLSDKDQNDKRQPMQSWPLWWFLRTYLQSLGQVNSGLCA
jgi:hypothetical protein